MSRATDGSRDQVRKMDAPRAMAILGLRSLRQIEAGTKDERRQMLDEQLFKRMQEVQVFV